MRFVIGFSSEGHPQQEAALQEEIAAHGAFFRLPIQVGAVLRPVGAARSATGGLQACNREEAAHSSCSRSNEHC